MSPIAKFVTTSVRQEARKFELVKKEEQEIQVTAPLPPSSDSSHWDSARETRKPSRDRRAMKNRKNERQHRLEIWTGAVYPRNQCRQNRRLGRRSRFRPDRKGIMRGINCNQTINARFQRSRRLPRVHMEEKVPTVRPAGGI